MNLQTLFYSGLISLSLAFVIPLLLMKQKRLARRVSLSLAFIGVLFFAALSSSTLVSTGTLSLKIATFASIIPFEFLIDKLAAFFILTIAIVALSAIIYSWSYVEQYQGESRRNLLTAFMNLFILSMIMIVTSSTTLLFLFSWEIMAISSFLLVYYNYDKPKTRKPGLYYFVMTSLSTVFLIIAFVILYNATGTFDIVRAPALPASLTAITFLCLFLGFAIKSGTIPFHKWLPYAHPAAPSNISALMSGLMIKIALYGLIRFVVFVFPAYSLWWGILILLSGAISAILGVIYALKEHDIKRLLAYHSIENIGIILMGFGLHVIFSFYHLQALAALSLAGALLHTLNHALFKSLLFLTSGSIVHSVKTKNIEEMGGLIKTMPVTAVLFLIGAVSISALPPFNGFVSEFMIFQSFFSGHLIANHSVQIVLVIGVSLFALTSALAAACFVKAFAIIFLGVPRSQEAKESKEAPYPMLIGPFILAVLCIVIGLFSSQIFDALGYPFEIPNMMYIGMFLLVAFLVFWIALYRSKEIRVFETWGCGYPLHDGKTEYTASGFSQPIVTIFSSIFRPHLNVEKKFLDTQQTIVESGHAEVRLFKFFEEKIYNPIILACKKVSGWVMHFHGRDVDSYIAYAFVVCLVLVIVIGVFL